MYILASHDIEMAYENHRREAARRSQPHRRFQRSSINFCVNLVVIRAFSGFSRSKTDSAGNHFRHFPRTKI